MERTRRSLACAIAAALVIGVAAPGAQAESPTDTASVHSLRPGAWALQFGISDNFTLTNFEGGSVSVKRHLTDSSAVRLGVTASASSNDSEYAETALPPDTLVSRHVSDGTQHRMSVSADYVAYPLLARRMNLFLGVGLVGSYSRSRGQTDVYDARFGATERDSELDQWSVGISGSIGVEWFAAPSISFHAEYGGALRYYSNKQTSTMPWQSGSMSRKSVTSSTATSFSLSSVRFGLSAYF